MTEIEKLVEECARADFDRRFGEGAFDAEKSVRLSMNLKWPTDHFDNGLLPTVRAVIRRTLEFVEASERKMAAPYAGRNDLFDRGSYAARMDCASWCASVARSISPKAEG